MAHIVQHHYERTNIFYPWVYWDGAFSDDEIECIAGAFAAAPKQRAGIGAVQGHHDEAVRRSNIAWYHRTADTAWIFDRLNTAIEQINDNFYQMDLAGYSALQYTEYRAEEAGMYDAHMDIPLDTDLASQGGIRKLSIALLLNDDFEGGVFEYNQGNAFVAMAAQKGRIIAFPSWLIHRVTPVTRGLRRSLVAWVVGPKFR